MYVSYEENPFLNDNSEDCLGSCKKREETDIKMKKEKYQVVLSLQIMIKEQKNILKTICQQKIVLLLLHLFVEVFIIYGHDGLIEYLYTSFPGSVVEDTCDTSLKKSAHLCFIKSSTLKALLSLQEMTAL